MAGVEAESSAASRITAHSKRRVLIELAVAYVLILSVIWTPRPWQRLLWWVAATAVIAITWASFDGLKAMGLSTKNFFRSFWIVGLALLIAAFAVVLAVNFHTLRLPARGAGGFFKNYWAYAIWAFAQQFLLQAFFLLRFLRLIPNPRAAALAATSIFAIAHLPSPILTTVTFVWGLAACLHFLRYRNLFSLALAHAVLGITISMTIPGPVDHNMRVGLGYLTYGHPHRHVQLPKP